MFTTEGVVSAFVIVGLIVLKIFSMTWGKDLHQNIPLTEETTTEIIHLKIVDGQRQKNNTAICGSEGENKMIYAIITSVIFLAFSRGRCVE